MKIANTTSLEVLEHKVTSFLQSYAVDEYSYHTISNHLAKVSLEPNHLYEDLNFPNRIAMGRYMKKHFPRLAEEKPKEKLWKKFIYDSIGEIAPACEKCNDQDNCFACRI